MIQVVFFFQIKGPKTQPSRVYGIEMFLKTNLFSKKQSQYSNMNANDCMPTYAEFQAGYIENSTWEMQYHK